MSDDFNKKIAFVGGGNMAEAVLSGLLRKQTVKPEEVFVSEKSDERRSYLEKTYQIETDFANKKAPQCAKTVFLAVKPQMLNEVKDELAAHLSNEHCVISILAGTSRDKLANALGFKERMVRVMPNLPALIGKGISAITFPPEMQENERDWCREILKSIGKVVEVDEPLQDVVTAVSGSGPGYIFYMAHYYLVAAINEGLSEDVAKDLVTETLIGAAELLNQRPETAQELVKKVATPGGTTEAGLSALEEKGFAGIMQETISRATNRSRELNQGK